MKTSVTTNVKSVRTRKTTKDVTVSFLTGRKRPVTAAYIAEKTGLNPATVQSTLRQLRIDEEVQVVGTLSTGKQGRPAVLYVAA